MREGINWEEREEGECGGKRDGSNLHIDVDVHTRGKFLKVTDRPLARIKPRSHIANSGPRQHSNFRI